MAEYLNVDSRKIGYVEYWNIARSPMVIVPWIAKLLGISMEFGSPVPRPASQRDMEIKEEQLSPKAHTALRQKLDACLSLGFHSPRYFFCQTLRGESKTSIIGLIHPSGRLSARLFCSIGENSEISMTKVLVVYMSELSDGTYFISSDQREMFKVPPSIIVNRMVGADVASLLKAHERKLAQFDFSNPPISVNNAIMFDDVWDRYERFANDFGIQRGVYVPISVKAVPPVPFAHRVPPGHSEVRNCHFQQAKAGFR